VALMARLVLDLDGTLIDSNPTLAATGSALLAELGRPPVGADDAVAFIGKGVDALVRALLEHTGGIPGGDLPPHVARFRAIYALDPITGTTVYDGVDEALAGLAADGHGLAVCTQKPNAPALVILREFGLMPPVTGFTGGDSLEVLKPDPRMLAHAADQLPPGPVILIGDSEIDAATAVASGVPFLLHTRGYRLDPERPLANDGAFADWAELPALVARLSAVP
jgi:phosphoglycolate phosphatase